MKDLFLAQLRGPGRPLMELKRDVLFVPENSHGRTRCCRSSSSTRRTWPCVLDEYGGASGIVSLENITEELFGQIQDEFDRERPEIEPLGNGRYRVRGDYLIEDLADRLKVDVGEPAEETIGGYVAARLGREVVPGDRAQLGDLIDRSAGCRTLPRALGDRADADAGDRRSGRERGAVSTRLAG